MIQPDIQIELSKRLTVPRPALAFAGELAQALDVRITSPNVTFLLRPMLCGLVKKNLPSPTALSAH
jgi:hypothetical protein